MYKCFPKNSPMISKLKITGRQHTFSETIPQLENVEKFVGRIAENRLYSPLTVLLKLGQYDQQQSKSAACNKGFINYWKHLLGPSTEFGLFFNEDIGTIFIVGPYSALFLQEVDGKKLGALSQGIYGILRGLGLSDQKTSEAIRKLGEGQYLLLGKVSRDD